MGYHRATYTCPSSSGDFTMSSLPFTPTRAKFTFGGKTINSTTESRRSSGWADVNSMWATAILVNQHGNFTRNYTNKCLVVLSTPGGSIDEEVLGTLVEFPTNACKVNFSDTVNNYQFLAEFWDD